MSDEVMRPPCVVDEDTEDDGRTIVRRFSTECIFNVCAACLNEECGRCSYPHFSEYIK